MKTENNLTVLDYNKNNITFSLNDGTIMVNATQMARQFNKQPSDWTKTKQAKDLLKALEISRTENLPNGGFIYIYKGGEPEKQGTWMHEDVALLFAQWLSPSFYIWCNDRVKELLVKGKPKKITNKTTYKNGDTFITKLGKFSILVKYHNNQLWYSLSSILKHLGYQQGGNKTYAQKYGEANYICHKVGKQNTWMVNRTWIETHLNNMRLEHLPNRSIVDLYSDLYHEQFLPENTYGELYEFKYTATQMLDIIQAINNAPVNKTNVINMLFEGANNSV